MLQIETVEPGTFSLLEKLQSIPELRDFSLVGGTALSLMYGHRISEDLDLFSNLPFQNEIVSDSLQKYFGESFQMEQKPPQFGIFCYINDIKVDLVKHPFPLIKPVKIIDGIRFFSTEDIIAIKVKDILGNGEKKDFRDFAELLEYYSIADFSRYQLQKFQRQYLLIAVPEALSYFGKAEESEDPISLKGQTWKKVKKSIERKVRDFLI